MVDAVKPFNEVVFTTKDGKTIHATKDNGVVTISGDKNGVRQMELKEFMNYLAQEAPKVDKTPNSDTVSFKGKVQENNENENADKKGASTAKKVGVGVASFFIPGVGQAINGEWGKALGFFGGAIAASFVLGPLAGLGVSIFSTIDAVKNVK